MNQKNREFDAIYLKLDEFQLCSDSFEQAGYLKAYKTINDLIEYTKKRSELDRVVIKLVERQSEFYHLLNHLQSKLDVGLGVSPLTQLKDHLDSEYVIDESADITGSVSIAQSSISSILRTKSSIVKPEELVKGKGVFIR